MLSPTLQSLEEDVKLNWVFPSKPVCFTKDGHFLPASKASLKCSDYILKLENSL